MDRDGRLRIGIVGLGKMGLLHATILNSLPSAKVVAICEKKKILVWYGKNLFPGVAIVERIQDFSSLNLDAVVVSTPIPSHFGIIEALYSIGVPHLFVEKTLAASGSESLKTCELAQKAGGVNMVGYMARYAVTFRKAKEWMADGAIGGLTSFSAYAYSSDFIGIEDRSFLRGGVVRDLGCHVIDLAFWYFGELAVETALLEPRQPANGEGTAHFKANAPNGLKGEFDISWCKEGYRIPDYGLVINGVQGSIEVSNDSVSITKDNKKQTWHRVDLNDNVPFMVSAPEYFREDAGFVDAILNKSRTEPDFVMASKVDSFIDQVKQEAGVVATKP
jgi:predicted dehydrogenase